MEQYWPRVTQPDNFTIYAEMTNDPIYSDGKKDGWVKYSDVQAQADRIKQLEGGIKKILNKPLPLGEMPVEFMLRLDKLLTPPTGEK